MTLERAHAAWRDGRLLEAQAGYRAVVSAGPESWPARFQLAWLDAAFGAISPERVRELEHPALSPAAWLQAPFGGPGPGQARALDRPVLSAAARQRVAVLVVLGDSTEHLDGSLRDWDIEALLAAGAQHDDDWWLERARRAWRAGQYGLADRCVDEAVARSVVLADDKPHWAVGLLTQADDHLRAIA